MTMTAVEPGHDFRSELAVAASLFRGLADPTRLAILRRLAGGEARIIDLTTQFGLAQSTVSTHVACLRDCGLVAGRPVGRQMLYSLTRPELVDLLASAENLLAQVGTQVSLCPTYGPRARSRDTGAAAEPDDD